ncbi:hypothetical protein, partial [Hyphomonas sp. UBA3201]|uniref:hypothetical protein n=1 Tax=Hyphomonas sp. UBA3201 TaxID=1946623 RepID=UPI0025C02024
MCVVLSDQSVIALIRAGPACNRGICLGILGNWDVEPHPALIVGLLGEIAAQFLIPSQHPLR